MFVVGVDPGLVTGLVTFSVADNKVLRFAHWQLDHIGTAKWFEDFRSVMNNTIEDFSDTIVAIETFTMTPKKTPSPWSLETIGAIRYFVETAGLKLRFVAPSAHKGLVSDAVLKRAGLWFPGEGHACDAARVSLYCAIIDKGLMEWTLLGKAEEESNAT